MTHVNRRALLIAGLLYVFAVAAWLVTQPMPALQDLGEWVFQAAVMLRLLDPSSPLHSQFAWVHIPVPNMLCQLFLMGCGLLRRGGLDLWPRGETIRSC
jgi:hypothetical protein